MFANSASEFASRLFARTTIKSQIWIGFGLFLAILLFLSLSTLGVFGQLNQGISQVTEKIQPVVLTAQNLEAELEADGNALGFFLLTKEDIYRNRYAEHLERAAGLLGELGSYEFVLANPQYSIDVDIVEQDLATLAGYRDRMLTLGESDLENVPAQRMASQTLNPMAQQLQSMISQNVVSINDVADENARASGELSRSSENLARIADELQDVVSHFKY